ncbi:MAG TPA: SDR family NAD(P)-dependent oxidoreductase [Gemmatimonadaceae bacterium]|jgi:NAD(P)-dependent dehydrogenase (short-subunit alcohol dehydrogenase family)|nr:SDR family NAD(P)-dependent oxidoreductase [Gemmatimonadaceae bacterium]
MPSLPSLAIVTGTSTGIGHAVAERLLAAGWEVVGAARRDAAIAHPRYRHLTVDLIHLRDVVTVFEAEVAPLIADPVRRRIGLVNNAASLGALATIDTRDPRASLAVYALNVIVPEWLMGFVLRHTRHDCALRIVNVSSGAAQRAVPGAGVYVGTKAALRMATFNVAAELGMEPLKSRVTPDVALVAYSPGTVATPMQVEARSPTVEAFPSQPAFQKYYDSGALVPPERPAAEIAAFLDSERPPRMEERRLGDGLGRPGA